MIITTNSRLIMVRQLKIFKVKERQGEGEREKLHDLPLYFRPKRNTVDCYL